ncbi:hypothetical protein O181_111062 [Austropuccinia psidii MF-1]|uniref:Uncharacterized protein n=1 Tax=Austropuccinia psidii MF-1 TaxID=1389203 RepID=A0A9Q3JZ87_9BASI|nr:hypothetical protein [Austropuccinia psidii MF-1]
MLSSFALSNAMETIRVIDIPARPHWYSIALNSIHPHLLGAIKFRDIVNSLTWESSYNPNPISANSTPSESHSPSQARCQRSGSLGLTLRRSSHIPNFNNSTSLSNPSTDFKRFQRKSKFSIHNINTKPFN